MVELHKVPYKKGVPTRFLSKGSGLLGVIGGKVSLYPKPQTLRKRGCWVPVGYYFSFFVTLKP